MTEAQLQKSVVEWLGVLEAQRHLRFFAVPNGGQRHVLAGANLKKQGMRRGVPDLVVLVRGRTVFWELKSAKGTVRPEQAEWAEWLRANRYEYALIRSLDDAQAHMAQLCMKAAA
jgi:hypothetical protein